jgi:hypothetical protein
MQYLRLKGIESAKSRKNGTKNIVPIFREKNRKFGKIIKEKAISRKRSILITGAHHSGKTRTLDRLYQYALDIWGGHPKVKGYLKLGQIQPISQWYEAEQVREWWESKNTSSDFKPWHKLKAWEKVELLPKYCKATNAALFLDDAHKLTGRKLDIAKKCTQSAKITVVTTSEEGRIPPNLRQVILPYNPQIIRLDSDVAYDGTNVFLWILILVSLGAGAYEIAVILGGLKWLGYGRRASKQE